MENGTGMLHLAVLAQNAEAIQYLTSRRISPKTKDKAGKLWIIQNLLPQNLSNLYNVGKGFLFYTSLSPSLRSPLFYGIILRFVAVFLLHLL